MSCGVGIYLTIRQSCTDPLLLTMIGHHGTVPVKMISRQEWTLLMCMSEARNSLTVTSVLPSLSSPEIVPC
eukprot:gene8182-8856_t